jgi:hypothetical protein
VGDVVVDGDVVEVLEGGEVVGAAGWELVGVGEVGVEVFGVVVEGSGGDAVEGPCLPSSGETK